MTTYDYDRVMGVESCRCMVGLVQCTGLTDHSRLTFLAQVIQMTAAVLYFTGLTCVVSLHSWSKSYLRIFIRDVKFVFFSKFKLRF